MTCIANNSKECRRQGAEAREVGKRFCVESTLSSAAGRQLVAFLNVVKIAKVSQVHYIHMQARLVLFVSLVSIIFHLANAQVTFASQWQVLGPFPRGMREIGADPLECWGILDDAFRIST